MTETTQNAGEAPGEQAVEERRISDYPTREGRFGVYGGAYVPETLVFALEELIETYRSIRENEQFWAELRELLRTWVGRPTPLYGANGLTRHIRSRSGKDKGAKIWLKREDLAHTGAHKINNALGQAMLAVKMGKTRIIAETGAGQHGVATATACAHLGLACDIYMGSEDARRQKLNVVRMQMLGARVIEVDSGSRTLKDATNEAMRDWMGSVETTHYIIGSVVGPHPFPAIVREFQSVIGREAMAQSLRAMGQMPDVIVACVGGGSNAAGIFYPMIEEEIRMIGVEAGGESSDAGRHAAPLSLGSPGILHGSMSYVLQDESGQTSEAHSCSAGLDYPGVGPEHSFWKDQGRVEYCAVTDQQALDAFLLLSRTEGIVPALETSHAIAKAVELAGEESKDANILVNLSGRGDKDVEEALRLMGGEVKPSEMRRVQRNRRKDKKRDGDRNAGRSQPDGKES